MKAPFPIDPALTAIALAYGNERFIADLVLPRTGVARQEFKYNKYALGDAFTIPNTLVGRKGRPTEVEFGATEATDATRNYGLEDAIPVDDIENAAGRFDPRGRAAALLAELVALDREKRTADLVFGAANYAAANKTTLVGAAQWSDGTSDPIKAIMDALDSMVMRPNVGVLGRATFSALSRHGKIVAAAYPLGGNADKGGTVARDAIARVLELDELIVGEGWYNSAKPNQPPTMTRLWGDFAAFIVRNKEVTTVGGVSFGYTAEWGTRTGGQREDPDIGLRGGIRVRVGESVKELLVANDLGYLFSDTVA
jgi:hypothetical protein